MKTLPVHIILLAALLGSVAIYGAKFRHGETDIDEVKLTLGDLRTLLEPQGRVGIATHNLQLEMTGWVQYVLQPVRVIPHKEKPMDTVLFIFPKTDPDTAIQARISGHPVLWQRPSAHYRFILTSGNQSTAHAQK